MNTLNLHWLKNCDVLYLHCTISCLINKSNGFIGMVDKTRLDKKENNVTVCTRNVTIQAFYINLNQYKDQYT